MFKSLDIIIILFLHVKSIATRIFHLQFLQATLTHDLPVNLQVAQTLSFNKIAYF